MVLIKLVFLDEDVCEEVIVGVLPAGVWLYNYMSDTGAIDKLSITMPYNQYSKHSPELSPYDYTTTVV